MKALIHQRIKSLTVKLREKELELREDLDFDDNPYTQDTVNNLRQDLLNTETFLNLTTSDPTQVGEIDKHFAAALDLIEQRIEKLIVIKVI